MNQAQEHTTKPTDLRHKLESLARGAISEIELMTQPVVQICGPISTGGFGEVEDNLSYLDSVIQASIRDGMSIFDQLAYERRLDHILGDSHGYDYPILDSFYAPILSSGKISGLAFLPLWETSTGSRWEHEYAQSIGIPTCEIQNLLVGEIRSFYESL